MCEDIGLKNYKIKEQIRIHVCLVELLEVQTASGRTQQSDNTQRPFVLPGRPELRCSEGKGV